MLEGLTFLDWVESDGTQHILTDIVPSADNFNFIAEYMLTGPINKNNKFCLIGARYKSGYQDYQFSSYGELGTLRYGSGSSITPYMAEGVRQTVSLIDGKFTRATGETGNVTLTSAAAPCPLAIFGLNQNGLVTQNGIFRLYSLCIRDGQVWHEFRPALLDEVAGLYDSATDEFLAPEVGTLAYPGGGWRLYE